MEEVVSLEKTPTGVFGDRNWIIKMVVSVIIDIGDFVVTFMSSIFGLPIISVVGTLYDIVTVPIGYAMWGKIGLLNIWEVIAITDIGNGVDAWIPTMTITGFISRRDSLVCRSLPQLCER